MLRMYRFKNLLKDKNYRIEDTGSHYDIKGPDDYTIGLVDKSVSHNFSVGRLDGKELTGVELYVIDKIIRFGMTDLERRTWG